MNDNKLTAAARPEPIRLDVMDVLKQLGMSGAKWLEAEYEAMPDCPAQASGE